MKVKEITLKVKSVQLLTGRGQDEVCLNFDDSVPTPYPACGYEGGANIRCQAHHGMQRCIGTRRERCRGDSSIRSFYAFFDILNKE